MSHHWRDDPALPAPQFRRSDCIPTGPPRANIVVQKADRDAERGKGKGDKSN